MAKQYEVIGNANVHGFNPGERFHADLEPEHEARQIKGGFIRIVPERERRLPVVEKAPEVSEADDAEKEE